jgi:phosphatidylglycerol:prolipoprotein diacylglycerol transferase
MSLLALIVNGHWVHDLPKFVPFLPHSEQIGVRFYGLAYVLGFVGGTWLLSRYAKRGRALVPAADVMDLLFAIMLGVFIGGRLGWFLLYHPELLLQSPLTFFAVWQGGMASHGGFLGVTIALAIYGRRRRVPLLHLGDLIVSTAPLGLMLGRIANFINGELWGKISDVRWAMIFPDSAPPGTALADIPPRHPSQLYEAFLEGALLLAYFQWRFWKSDVVRQRPGRLSGEFLLAYAIVRAIGEHFREPDEGISLMFGLSRGTFYSLFVAIAGIILIVTRRRPLVLPKPQSKSSTL